MAIKTVTVRKGDINKELEVQKLIKEGFIITNENTDNRTGDTVYILESAFNMTV